MIPFSIWGMGRENRPWVRGLKQIVHVRKVFRKIILAEIRDGKIKTVKRVHARRRLKFE